jgi:hypothetical protein
LHFPPSLSFPPCIADEQFLHGGADVGQGGGGDGEVVDGADDVDGGQPAGNGAEDLVKRKTETAKKTGTGTVFSSGEKNRDGDRFFCGLTDGRPDGFEKLAPCPFHFPRPRFISP